MSTITSLYIIKCVEIITFDKLPARIYLNFSVIWLINCRANIEISKFIMEREALVDGLLWKKYVIDVCLLYRDENKSERLEMLPKKRVAPAQDGNKDKWQNNGEKE